MKPFAAVLLLLGLVACGDEGTPVATGERDPDQVYEVDATVLQDANHGPQLCLGGIQTSLPPQCGGPEVVGWDWAAVEGEEAVNDTTWGQFHLVGTFDGSFRLTEPVGAYQPPADVDDPAQFRSRCPEPDGGWRVVDETKVAESDWIAVDEYTRAQSDYGGAYVDQSINPQGPTNENTKLVYNALFTGNLDRHEQEMRARWGGPICVSEVERTEAELLQIQERLVEEAKGPPLFLLTSSPDQVRSVIEATVILADDVAQHWADERFGEGVVELTGRLRPVD